MRERLRARCCQTCLQMNNFRFYGVSRQSSLSAWHIFNFLTWILGHRRMKHIEQYLITLHAGPARDNSSARSHSKFVCFGCFWQLTSPGSSWSANLWSHVFCGHPIVRCPEGLHFHSRRTQRCSGSIGSPCKDSPAQLFATLFRHTLFVISDVKCVVSGVPKRNKQGKRRPCQNIPAWIEERHFSPSTAGFVQQTLCVLIANDSCYCTDLGAVGLQSNHVVEVPTVIFFVPAEAVDVPAVWCYDCRWWFCLVSRYNSFGRVQQ